MLPPVNKGAEILGRLLRERGSQSELAEQLSSDPGYVSRIVRGLKIPGLGMRRKLKSRYGIALELWDEPAEATDVAH